MTLPKNFKAEMYDRCPPNSERLFDPDSFNSPALHLEAESDARELIVQALTTRLKVPCHSIENMRSTGYMKRNAVTLEDIAAGKVRLV